MNRPYIIVHMINTIDGKSTGKWMMDPKLSGVIKGLLTKHTEFNGDAFAVGKTTMEEFTKKYKEDISKFSDSKLPYEDYISPDIKKKYFCVSFDRKGSLFFKSNTMQSSFFTCYNDAHIIQILTEQVKPDYLAYLQSLKISYIFGGKQDIDIKAVLKKLKEKFGITKIILSGGPTINEAFLKEEVIDELSIFVVSLTGCPGGKSTFNEGHMQHFNLTKCEAVFENNYIWLNYKKS